MAKVGRNQPCPCGSGKKYKQCCLVADEAAENAAREEQRRNAPPPAVIAPVPHWGPAVDDDYDRLDEMSNGAVDLIRAGKLDDAERACQRLLDLFPDLPDGHIRLGQLFRARGESKLAAQHLRLAAAVSRANNDDNEMTFSLEAEADELDPSAA
jgi:tetratricopeptide (TPR) repeat protein